MGWDLIIQWLTTRIALKRNKQKDKLEEEECQTPVEILDDASVV